MKLLSDIFELKIFQFLRHLCRGPDATVAGLVPDGEPLGPYGNSINIPTSSYGLIWSWDYPSALISKFICMS